MTEPVAAPHPASRHSLALSVVVAAVVLAADQATKHWAINRLSGGRKIHVVWTLQFNLTFNSGMAFSRGRGLGPVIGVIALVVVAGLLVNLRRTGSRTSTIAVGMVIGGALGNVTDRLLRGDAFLRGAVVDFIDFQWFPIFNVADIAIDVGGVLLLVGMFLDPRRRGGSVGMR